MNEAIRILVIDESEKDVNVIINSIIENQYNCYCFEWVSDYSAALKKICGKRYDICLVDYHIGGAKGLSLIKRATRCGCYLPMILMVNREDPEIGRLAMKAGAADYFVKGGHSPAALLERRIRYPIAVSKKIQKVKSLNRKLEKQVSGMTKELFQSYKDLEYLSRTLFSRIREKEREKQKTISVLKKERALNEFTSRFISSASHEFRTPLSAILSSASLIEQYAGIPGKKNNILSHIHRIKFTVDELIEILNNLLLLERLEGGKVKCKKEVFNLGFFAEEVINEIRECVKPGQKIIYYKPEEECSEVFLDPCLLKNILLNLITNAIKFSGEYAGIFITTEVIDKDVLVTVRDEGMGIPEEDQKHLFKKFFRAGNAKNIQGTGLGLNIVKNYLDLADGTIEFESQVDKGSTFTVKFKSASVIPAGGASS